MSDWKPILYTIAASLVLGLVVWYLIPVDYVFRAIAEAVIGIGTVILLIKLILFEDAK